MDRLHATPFSHLTDEEFLRFLLHKTDPTAEDVEAAQRLEGLLESYSGLLQEIHMKTHDALGDTSQTRTALQDIQDLTAPVSLRRELLTT